MVLLKKLVLASLMLAAGCSNPDRDIVPYVADCGAYQFSTHQLFVVRTYNNEKFTASICDVRSGCSALFSYFDAPIPVVRKRADGKFDIFVMGGSIGKIHTDVVMGRNRTATSFNVIRIVGRPTPDQMRIFPLPKCAGTFNGKLIPAP